MTQIALMPIQMMEKKPMAAPSSAPLATWSAGMP